MASEALENIRAEVRRLNKLLRDAESLASGPGISVRERQRRLMGAKAAAERDIQLKPIADPCRRAECEADIYKFLPTYMSEKFKLSFTENQREMVEAIMQCGQFGGDKAIAAPRGGRKTTTTEGVVIYCLLLGLLRFPLIVAATGPDAARILDNIKHELEFNDLLAADYPEVCGPIRALEGAPQRANMQTVGGARTHIKWSHDLVVLPTVPGSKSSGSVLMTRGLDAAVRGIKYHDLRPDLVLIDDAETRESAASEHQCEIREQTIDRDIAGLGGLSQKVARVFLGTCQNRSCVTFKFTDPTQKPSFGGVRYRFVIRWPDRKELWEEYVRLRQTGMETGDRNARQAHAFYLENRAAMDAGVEVNDVDRFESIVLADGSRKEVSPIQHAYNFIADKGPEAFATEYQNDPPENERESRLLLTSHHIQNNCGSGLEKREVPEGTVCITVGGDVQKLGLHYVAIAWSEEAAGCLIDYDFFEFRTAGKAAADCELEILEGLFAWHAAQQEHPFVDKRGEQWLADLTLIDTGWKEESWNSQPVQVFCGQVGFNACLPSKGVSPYHRPKDSRNVIHGEHWHVAFPGGVPVVQMNSDHWKLKVHEGFLAERGKPGSLSLFEPPRIDGRRARVAHLSYSKHILAETWESRFVPGFRGMRTGWWKSPKANHYFDATYQAIVGRSMWGLSVLNRQGTQPLVGALAAPRSESYSPLVTADSDSSRSRW